MVINGPRREKTCLRVSDKTKFKPVSSAKETSKKIEISFLASLDMILSKKRITKALVSLATRPIYSMHVAHDRNASLVLRTS